jgi:hypothetical protein
MPHFEEYQYAVQDQEKHEETKAKEEIEKDL